MKINEILPSICAKNKHDRNVFFYARSRPKFKKNVFFNFVGKNERRENYRITHYL